MEVFAATSSASLASPKKAKSPEGGFDKVLDRARADAAPPGANPPEKETNTQAGEVAGTEQKTPPQKLDSQPEQGKNAAQIAALNPALLAALVNVIAEAPAPAPAAPANDNTAQAAAVPAQGQIQLNAPKTSAPKAPESGAEEDPESGEDGDEPTTGVSIKALTQPELGKVKIKVQTLTEGQTDTPADEDADVGSQGESAPAANDNFANAGFTVTTPKHTDAAPSAKHSQPLSNEHRELVFRQVSDRMELLAASRPKEAVTIHLQPPDLGDVTVVLKNEGVKLSAEFFASHEGVRDALKQDSGKLTEQLQTKGVAMTHVSVNAGAQPQQTGSNTHYRDRHPAQGFQNNPDAQNQSRGQQDSRNNNFAPGTLREGKTAKAPQWGRNLTAVDLSI